jgi:outer membrane protein assembly factor BamD
MRRSAAHDGMHMLLNRSPRARACLGAVMLVALALSPACASKEKKAVLAAGTDADKYLFEQGNATLAKRNWLRAREYYRQIVDNYPQSRFRPEAKLGLADTYLGENSVGSLILGANEYREFLTFFPTHDRAYYAQYQLARTHYQQMLAPQRDQTQTRMAIVEYVTFLERFPDSPLAPEGRKSLQECRDRLSDADYQVGFFYYRSKWYPGAIARFRAVLKDNAGYTRRDALYYYLADSYVRVAAPAEALPLLDKLTKEFDKSPFLFRAQQLTASIKSGAAMESLARDAEKKAKKIEQEQKKKKVGQPLP